MASIHIEEIQRILSARGCRDALPHRDNEEGYFLEIRFDNADRKPSRVIDNEYGNKVITLDCPYGTVTIVCDEEGQLRSIDLS